MKSLLSLLMLVSISVFSFSQEKEKHPPAGAAAQAGKPKAVYSVGAAKITVWENIRKDSTIWKTYKVEKVYKKGNEWKTSSSFDEKELLELKAVIEKAISEEAVKTKEIK